MPGKAADGFAADNLVMALYFLVLFALPSVGWLKKRYADRVETVGEIDGVAAAAPGITLGGMATALALAATLCAVGYGLASWLGWSSAGILLVTAMTVALATLRPVWNDRPAAL